MATRAQSPGRRTSRLKTATAVPYEYDSDSDEDASDESESEAPELQLNPIEVGRRIKNWLGKNLEHSVVEYDEDSVDSVALRFKVHSDDENVPLDIQPALLLSARKLGPAFKVTAEDGFMTVSARQPTRGEALRIKQGLLWRASVLAKSVWRIDVIVLLMLLSLFVMVFSASKLHDHWHGYDSPWETLVHWLLLVPIAIGNKMREVWQTVW